MYTIFGFLYAGNLHGKGYQLPVLEILDIVP